MFNIFNKHPLIKGKPEDLINNPVIIKVNSFHEEALKTFNTEFNSAINSGQNIIPILIDSYGGGVNALLGMITIIQSSPIPVATIIESKGMSCGAMLFMMGAQGFRFMAPYSSLMIHDVSSYTSGKLEDLKSSVKYTEYLSNLVFGICGKNIGKSNDWFKEQLKDKHHAEWYLDAKECKELNIANHIRVPNFITNIEVSSYLE